MFRPGHFVSSRSDVNGGDSGEGGVKRESVPTTGSGEVTAWAAVRFVKRECLLWRTRVSRLGAAGIVGAVSPLGSCRLLEASASVVRWGS